MKTAFISTLFLFVLLALPVFASVSNYEEINGYVWTNMDYGDKTIAVITLAKEILSEGRVSTRFSPEIALVLCFKTDEFYNSSRNMPVSIINAWLSISKNMNSVSFRFNEKTKVMMRTLGLRYS